MEGDIVEPSTFPFVPRVEGLRLQLSFFLPGAREGRREARKRTDKPTDVDADGERAAKKWPRD